MGWENSVRIVDEDGEPVIGYKVSIVFGLWHGHDSEYTDDDGWATFSYDNIDKDSMKVKYLTFESETLEKDIYIENGDTRS